MIELNSITAVLMVEALVGLILLILISLLFHRKRNSGNQTAAHKLIDKLEETEKSKAIERGEIVKKHCDIDPDILDELMNEVSIKERELYKQIVQIFLNRDVESLMQIDQTIDQLAEPYLSIASYSALNNEASGEELETTENTINSLKQESDILREKLATAMDTMEEISAEYSRVFNGTQTELELNNSSKKMFQVFLDTEKRINKVVHEAEREES